MEIFDVSYKHKILAFTSNFFAEKKSEMSAVNQWGIDVSERLLTFMSQGKMIRGGLVLFLYEAYRGELRDDVVGVAAAVEILHSSILIHDDIMDNDVLRRGKPTIFSQYQSLGERDNFLQSYNFGMSMGICAGDEGFFLAFQMLCLVEDRSVRQTIIELCLKEMRSVVLAQMQDVYSGHAKESVSEEEIEKLYRYKTGRYTFSLPLVLGAVLAGQSADTLAQLELLGETVGILFQLRDDELSLFGTKEVTGKPEGSDIRENKKTLYRLYLFEKALPGQRKELEKIFGKGEITPEQLAYVRELIVDLSVQEMIDKRAQNLHNKAKDIIMMLDLAEVSKVHLLRLLDYISERKK